MSGENNIMLMYLFCQTSFSKGQPTLYRQMLSGPLPRMKERKNSEEEMPWMHKIRV